MVQAKETQSYLSGSLYQNEPIRRWGLLFPFGSFLLPPFLTQLLVRGLYFQATELLGPANLDDQLARTAITALLGEKAESHLRKIIPKDCADKIPYEAADRAAGFLKKPRDLSLSQIDRARRELAQLGVTQINQIEERVSRCLIISPAKGAETSQALTLPPEAPSSPDEQKVLMILLQREASLRVLERAFTLDGVRTTDVWGDLLRGRLVGVILAKTPFLALDHKEAERLMSLLVSETLIEGAPEVLAGCASAISQIMEAEIVKRHKQESERIMAADRGLQVQAVANLASKNAWASYIGSGLKPEDGKYEFSLEPARLIALADALVSLSWRLPPEVYEKAAKIAGDLLVQGEKCLPEPVIKRLTEAADLYKSLSDGRELWYEERIPLTRFIDRVVSCCAAIDTERLVINVVFDKTENRHSINVRGLKSLSEEMVPQCFEEIASRAALLCPCPLSTTIELSFETDDFLYTATFKTEEVLAAYYKRGRRVDTCPFDTRMPMQVKRQTQNQGLIPVQ